MERFDIVIIGAGVVGLAITARLSKKFKKVLTLETHPQFGQETSSRNSEVIHAGFYYPSDSLKTKLCVEGNRLMYEFCKENSIRHKNCGKLLVASSDEEQKKIQYLYNQGNKNGVPGLTLLDKKEINTYEPHVVGSLGMWCPSSGIVDTHHLMKTLESIATSQGAIIAYGTSFIALRKKTSGFEFDCLDLDGETLTMESSVIINAAGLHSDKIASLAGLDVEKLNYKIHYCKGEYFKVSNRHKGKLSHLVYPAPTPISLGVHGVLGLDGSLKLGPSAFYVDKINYDVDDSHGKNFYEQGRKIFPFIEMQDLTPDMAGIRPKLQSGDEFRDFVITNESSNSLDGLINLIGIESPGLTSCLAIGEYVSEMTKTCL